MGELHLDSGSLVIVGGVVAAIVSGLSLLFHHYNRAKDYTIDYIALVADRALKIVEDGHHDAERRFDALESRLAEIERRIRDIER